MSTPLTTKEQIAKTRAEEYLASAKRYLAAHDLSQAYACVTRGYAVAFGISRPLAVRDQLRDVEDALLNQSFALMEHSIIGVLRPDHCAGVA
jgi:hypothetical protein